MLKIIPHFETVVEPLLMPATARREIEFVERKGLGHPDSICDAVMESVSVALSRAYLDAVGHVLHHNVDKGLLVAGQTTPKLGGGAVKVPMRLVIGDRATSVFGNKTIPVGEIAEQTARDWFRKHLKHVDPDKHLIVQNELHPGSAELTDIFDTKRPASILGLVANDTSVGVGFAPLTETERLVLAAEHLLNSADFKHEFPETGEDVKVMAVRRGRKLEMTVAIAFIDKYFWQEETYFHRKAAVWQSLTEFLQTKLHDLDSVNVRINTLDREGQGLNGMYLTVLGTSAEGADGGEVGRGNRVNGLITFCRPMTMEAAAGKNPVSHVGKIYNQLARQVAERICQQVDAVEEACVWLCSRIGAPLDEPWVASVQVALKPDATIADVKARIQDIVGKEVVTVSELTQRLTRGELSVC